MQVSLKVLRKKIFVGNSVNEARLIKYNFYRLKIKNTFAIVSYFIKICFNC